MSHRPGFMTRRQAGVLLHPSSLPGSGEQGRISHEAFRFVEFLAACGMSVWQMLPLSAVHADDGSPYRALSSHACEPALISLAWLRDRELLPKEADSTVTHQGHLLEAYEVFKRRAEPQWRKRYDRFRADNADWLTDYSLFMTIREQQGLQSWQSWDKPLRCRDEAGLRKLEKACHAQIDFHCFVQFILFEQLAQLRDYAHQHGISLFGDLPIYVALDSADVWARQDLFLLDDEGHPTHVAGVPPDYFSEKGQLWGNPLYDWSAMQQDGFRWWQDRIRTQLKLYDMIRIDHFRGLQAYWSVPADAETAMEGEWIEAPGEAMLNSLHEAFGRLPLIAEDLGVITDEVTHLRKHFRLPGMKILQFAFDGDPQNLYLPHHHETHSVVYTGTHDNDTTLGWYQSLATDAADYVCDYLGITDGNDMPWPMIRSALASVSHLAILPMQDILGLGSEHRMNTPGLASGNWRWRFQWSQMPVDLTGRLHQLNALYGRLPL